MYVCIYIYMHAVLGMDYCYDCTSEVYVLKRYLLTYPLLWLSARDKALYLDNTDALRFLIEPPIDSDPESSSRDEEAVPSVSAETNQTKPAASPELKEEDSKEERERDQTERQTESAKASARSSAEPSADKTRRADEPDEPAEEGKKEGEKRAELDVSFRAILNHKVRQMSEDMSREISRGRMCSNNPNNPPL